MLINFYVMEKGHRLPVVSYIFTHSSCVMNKSPAGQGQNQLKDVNLSSTFRGLKNLRLENCFWKLWLWNFRTGRIRVCHYSPYYGQVIFHWNTEPSHEALWMTPRHRVRQWRGRCGRRSRAAHDPCMQLAPLIQKIFIEFHNSYNFLNSAF